MSAKKKSATKNTSESKTAATKPAKKPKRSGGALDVAAHVLKENGQPMSCGEIMKIMLEKGLWKTKGKTPASTLYSAIVREVKDKGKQSRFAKTERGKFALSH